MNKWYTRLSIAALLGGCIYFLIHYKYIIISFDRSSYHVVSSSNNAVKKQINFYFYNNDAWQKESVELVWSKNPEQALKTVANQWFTLAHAEKLITKNITVSHASLTVDGKAYLNFDQLPFSQQQLVREKFFLIQGLLKSIKESGLAITGVYFLMNNQPFYDYHLDFSIPWSLEPYVP